MTLLTAGYWQSTYWAENYWMQDYWAEYGVAPPPAPVEVETRGQFPRRRVTRRKKFPMDLARAIQSWLKTKEID